MTEPFGPLVSAEWLAQHLGDSDLQLLDTRYYLDGRSNREGYRAGHIPGAIYIDIDEELTGAEGPGRHPLPTAEEFTRALRRRGVRDQGRFVVYDDTFPAPRLRWMLRHFGHLQVAVLDGGLGAWRGALERGDGPPLEEGDFTAIPPPEDSTIAYDQVRGELGSLVLLDARLSDRFRGEVAPGDPRTGRIPGARPASWRETNLDAHGSFLPPKELRRRYRELGVTDPARAVAYCGSGVQACHDLLAMELAGLEGARLYVGSWSDWSRHPDAPVETAT